MKIFFPLVIFCNLFLVSNFCIAQNKSTNIPPIGTSASVDAELKLALDAVKLASEAANQSGSAIQAEYVKIRCPKMLTTDYLNCKLQELRSNKQALEVSKLLLNSQESKIIISNFFQTIQFFCASEKFTYCVTSSSAKKVKLTGEPVEELFYYLEKLPSFEKLLFQLQNRILLFDNLDSLKAASSLVDREGGRRLLFPFMNEALQLNAVSRKQLDFYEKQVLIEMPLFSYD